MIRHSLSDAFQTLHANEKAYTFAPFGNNPNRTYNRLDYILVTQDIMDNSFVGSTDHLGVDLSLGPPDNLEKLALGLWRHNDELNEDPEFIEKTIETLKVDLGGLDPSADRWEFCKYVVRKCSRNRSAMIWKHEHKEKGDLEKELLSFISDPQANHTCLSQVKEALENIYGKEGSD